MYTTTKRFPTSCRFYIQGNCRAGQECQFTHVFPLKDSPNTNPFSTQDLDSVQLAVRNSELDQLKRKYSEHIQKNIEKSHSTLIELLLPIENRESLKVLLIIPFNYPDTQCTLQIQDIDITVQAKSDIQAAFENSEWHQMRHKSLEKQLDWLTTHFASV